MVRLDDYQSTSSAGFIFGIIVSLLFLFSSSFYIFKFSFKDNDQYAFAIDEPCKKYQKFILVWRIVVAIYGIVGFILQFDEVDGIWSWAYYTNWMWTFLTAYFLVGVFVSYLRIFKPEIVPKLEDLKSGKDVNAHVKRTFVSFQILGEINGPSAILVVLVVWAYLAPSHGDYDPYLTWESISKHILNFVFISLDFVVSGYIFNPKHWAFLLFVPSIYVFFCLLMNVAYGYIAYSFMKTDNKIFIGWLLGLAVVYQVFFFIFYGLSKCKAKKFIPNQQSAILKTTSQSQQQQQQPDTANNASAINENEIGIQ